MGGHHPRKMFKLMLKSAHFDAFGSLNLAGLRAGYLSVRTV